MTSKGVALVYSWNAATNTLSANAGARRCSQCHRSATGAYTVTLEKQVDHPFANTEDNLLLNLPFTVTDSGGDSITGTLALTINDDSPTISVTLNTEREGPPVGLLALDETIGAAGGDRYNAGETESNGGPPNGNLDDTGVTVVTVSTTPTNAQAIGELKTAVGGGLGSLFTVTSNFGADGAGSVASALKLVLSSATVDRPDRDGVGWYGAGGMSTTDHLISLVQVSGHGDRGRVG